MTQQIIALLEKNGFVNIEHAIAFIAEAYVLTHRETSPDQALSDLDADLKALIGTRYQIVADIAWKYLSPLLRPVLQSAISAALASGVAGSAEAPALPQLPGGQTAA
ncbi:MAG: hypothetical protein P4L33_03330 [Capsulimonadaceae bacterium]|nr:hypothetical protein [Capsulimonadaceae bacterium]